MLFRTEFAYSLSLFFIKNYHQLAWNIRSDEESARHTLEMYKTTFYTVSGETYSYNKTIFSSM